MSDVRDCGIAVRDAIRLDECFAELTENFVRRPSVEGDEADWVSNFYASEDPDGELTHKWRSRDVAQQTMLRAIKSRELPLWVRLLDREEQADPNAIRDPNPKLFREGRYLPDNDPGSWLADRPLWVKRIDWVRFSRAIISTRYGEFDLPDLFQTLSAPLPATIEGAGPVMGLDEAINLLAFGRYPRANLVITGADDGILVMGDFDDEWPAEGPDSGEGRYQSLKSAHLELWKALKLGHLRSYVQSAQGEALVIRPFYWFERNPERLDIVYHASTKDRTGAGNPVLVSVEEFGRWLESKGSAVPPAKRGKANPSSIAAQPKRMADVALRKWFERLTEGEKAMAADKLWELCKSANPDKSITRHRVRALVPHRKQGPRPIRQNRTA